MIDRHYTPVDLADIVAEALRFRSPVSPAVADFASGDGGLLRAVAKRYPGASLIASDVDAAAVAAGRARHPNWGWATCDFLRDRSVAASPVLRAATELDGIVLNPPYSCRGQRTILSRVLDEDVRTGPALAFIVRSVPRLSSTGEMAVLVPAGSLTSEKDAHGWEVLRKLATVTLMEAFGRRAFRGAYASTVLVHLRMGASDASRAIPSPTCGEPLHELLTLHRGRIPAASQRLYAEAVPLLHTTDLVSDPSQLRRSGPATHALKKPLLTIPRVGRPDPRKIRLLGGSDAVVLSDCLLALTGPEAALSTARDRILAAWPLFASCYSGSCAPYTTLRTLAAALDAIGIRVQLEPRLASRHGIELPQLRRGRGA